MCIKPYPSPINSFSSEQSNIGVCRSFKNLNDEKLRIIRNLKIQKKKDMPKKNVIIRNVALGNSTQTLPNTITKLKDSKYGLRAANERTSSRRDKDFIYDVDKLSSAQKVQVKTDGDSLRFIAQNENEEELEGGISEEVAPKQSPVKLVSNQGLPIGSANNASTNANANNFHVQNGSEKASAGTMAFVQILLHTLSCSLSCQQPSCRKMGMVLKHYQTCQEKRRKEAMEKLKTSVIGESKEEDSKTSPKCGLCQQFAKIVAQHSMYLCNYSPQETGCPVPMCDMMRKIRDSRKNLIPVPMQT